MRGDGEERGRVENRDDDNNNNNNNNNNVDQQRSPSPTHVVSLTTQRVVVRVDEQTPADDAVSIAGARAAGSAELDADHLNQLNPQQQQQQQQQAQQQRNNNNNDDDNPSLAPLDAPSAPPMHVERSSPSTHAAGNSVLLGSSNGAPKVRFWC
jgi:hypothetical protein